MKPFLKEVPKEIDNIYLEYENLFSDCVHYAGYSRIQDEANKDSGLTDFEFIIKYKKLEHEFKEVIECIKKQLIVQFKDYQPAEIISFVESQKNNFNDYLPEKRKVVIYNSYLVCNMANGDESILDEKIELTESHKNYVKFLYSKYQYYFNELRDECNTLFDNYKLILINSNIQLPKETKTDKLKAELGKYGFFELPKVKYLAESNKQSLVELISTNGLPYSIAMIDYLGFLKYIEIEHFKTKYRLNKEVAKWFNSDKEGRAVKGNISTLSDFSKEDKSKYTAHKHKETVKTDYQKLK